LSELRPLARADSRVELRETIPGIGALLGLTIATEIDDIARFASARKLVGYASLAPKIKQSGQSSRSGPLSKAGSQTLRWAAVEAAQHAWRETNPWHEPYRAVAKRKGKANAGKAAVARKISSPPGTSYHANSPSSPVAVTAAPILSRPAPTFIWPPEAHNGIEKPGQLQPT